MAKKKEAHMYHHSVMLCSWQIHEAGHAPLFVVHTIVHPSPFVVHSPFWVVHTPLIGGRIFRWAEPCVAARPWTPNGWNTTGLPQVLGRSVEEPVNLIFIGSTKRSNLHPQIRIKFRMGQRIVPISLPQPAIIGILKIKKVIIIFNSIKIITYKIKWILNKLLYIVFQTFIFYNLTLNSLIYIFLILIPKFFSITI